MRLCWVSKYPAPGRHIGGHYGSGADLGARPDADTFENNCPNADPNIVAEDYRPGDEARTLRPIAMRRVGDGVLLAPITAAIVADLIENRQCAVDIVPYSPSRF